MRKRSFIVVVLVLLAVWSSRSPEPARGLSVATFPLKLNGTSWQPLVQGVPGKKLGVGKVKDKDITAVLQGALDDFAADFLDLDGSGRFFLFYDGNLSWRVATNSAGTDATTLEGMVSNDGIAWMFGEYELPMLMGTGKVFVTAKVKFQKGLPFGVYVPTSVKGVFHFASEDINTGLILKFKTDKPL
jgi:hypothetical protein